MHEVARGATTGAGTSTGPTVVSTYADEQRRILEGLATGTPLAETLTRITRLLEREAPDVRASVLLVQGRHLRHGAAPSLPAFYTEGIDGLEIGEGVGSCGTAAATAKACVVEDVTAHAFWDRFRALAERAGVRACWSSPIMGRGGEVLGTFALYAREPRGPRAPEERLVADATHLASIAIQHDRLLKRDVARLAAEHRRAQLRDLLHRAPMPVAVLRGPDFTYDFANGAYERLVHRSGLEGRRVADVFPELEAQGILQLLRSIYETGEAYHDPELRAMLDRGAGPEECWFNVRIEPYADADSSERGLLVLGVEVTEQVRARHDLDARRAELAMREKTSALGQLVSGVAHEIRTPLTYLTTHLNLIQMRLDRLVRSMPAEQAQSSRMLVDEYIPSALEAADRINHIVEDLRGFSQLRNAAREAGSLKETVAQAVHLFQATHRGRVHVRLQHDGDGAVLMDRLQVQQAVLNLLQNALEAQPRDHTIVVRVGRADSTATVSVADSGNGIPAAAQARVFDPFFTTREGGTGLGLSIVKRVVDEHGGKVAFDTGPAGTTFRLAFPLASE